MTRGGRVKARIEPERRCIVTRESGPKAGLIRFVAAPDGEIVPDLAERLPGRGIWVSAEPTALAKAAGKGYFARAAKRQVRVPPDLGGAGRGAARRAGGRLIALARKAGQAVAGLEKTKAALVSGRGGAAVAGGGRVGARTRAASAAGGRKQPCFVPFRARIGFGIRPGSCDTCRRAGGRSRATGFETRPCGCQASGMSRQGNRPGDRRDGPMARARWIGGGRPPRERLERE